MPCLTSESDDSHDGEMCEQPSMAVVSTRAERSGSCRIAALRSVRLESTDSAAGAAREDGQRGCREASLGRLWRASALDTSVAHGAPGLPQVRPSTHADGTVGQARERSWKRSRALEEADARNFSFSLIFPF